MENLTKFANDRELDLICFGRMGVDLYANQIGSRLEDVTSFNKYLGGSSANIAFGCARLGLKSSMLTRVGDEHMGRFLRETLKKEGCDTGHVITDPDRLTASVILGIKDKETFPLIFLRENCADMAVSPDDFSEEYIASAKAFLITGTHLSTSEILKTAKTALEYARKNDVKTVLDIDYRPVLWGLTGKGDGETRFVASGSVTEHLQDLVHYFDLIVGTEEEFYIAGGSTDIIECLKSLRKKTDAVFVVKRGPYGCSVIPGEVPEQIDDAFTAMGVRVDVLNVLGAGDAFMSGFLKGWLRSESYDNCCRYANLCGALVVSRHSCSPSMPSVDELEYYLKNAESIPRPDKDPILNRLHRVSIPRKTWKDLCIFAFDHRMQIEDLFEKFGKSQEEIGEVKMLMLEAAQSTYAELSEQYDGGVLIDDRLGEDALNAITGKGRWIGRPVELPGSRPLQLECGDNLGGCLNNWPAEHILKCLVFFHPNDPPDIREQQEKTLKNIYDCCFRSGHEFLLEVIPPADMPSDENTLADTMERIYELGIYPDWWKLPPQTESVWKKLTGILRKHDSYCHGIVILGLSKPLDDFEDFFKNAAKISDVKGFAVGRSIFQEPLTSYLNGETDDRTMVRQISDNFRYLCNLWDKHRNN